MKYFNLLYHPTLILILFFYGCDSAPKQQASYNCPQGTLNEQLYLNGKGVCALQGVITQNLTLSPDRVWSLSGGVHVGIDSKLSATLTIQKGTTIIGSRGADYLLINRGSKIHAYGTKEAPIIFTSRYELKGQESQAGDWGGVVIAGYARTNSPSGEEKFEFSDDNIRFGGHNDHDDSGVMKYVIIKYAGNEVRPGEELNGLSLGGVGDKTHIDYLEVYNGKDDGIEIWGGTVNLKHVVLVGNQDDAFDTDHGYRGKVQYLYVKQTRLTARYARGIESDNHKSHFDSIPRSHPTIANFELHGIKGSKEGVMLRRGSSISMINGYIEGFEEAQLGINDAQTLRKGRPTFTSVALNAKTDRELYRGQYSISRDEIETFLYQHNRIATHTKTTDPSNVKALLKDSFFDEALFIGAYSELDDWRQGWAVGL